jgi:hypothetical protein
MVRINLPSPADPTQLSAFQACSGVVVQRIRLIVLDLRLTVITVWKRIARDWIVKTKKLKTKKIITNRQNGGQSSIMFTDMQKRYMVHSSSNLI